MSALTWEHRVCDLPEPRTISIGLDAITDGLIGQWRRRGILGELRRDAKAVDALDCKFRESRDAQLHTRIDECRSWFRRERVDRDCLLEALALIREVAARQLGMRPFVVQLMGALALHRGYLAEMATGEGKSLTAAIAATLAAWNGRPCHVVTVNDYLAERDAQRFEPLFAACGLTSGHVSGAMQTADRARGHAADVTYTTSKELAGDFLRDRLCLGDLQNATRWKIRMLGNAETAVRQGVVMRGLHTAIVDEADSVLIDEAVTPLIIAGPAGNDDSEHAYQLAWTLASRLHPDVDYRVDPALREIELLAPGMHRLEACASQLPPLWRATARQRELITQALNARELFHSGKQYVVHEGKVVIVDEFTGRLMPLRKWRHGLHQAIEAKEGVVISKPDETLARLSFQRFFRLFRKLSGMTGTGAEAASEFWRIYRLPVVAIPPNRPRQRKDLPDRMFPDLESKWSAVVEEIAQRHATGQPLLVGTRNVATSEMLAERLLAKGFPSAVLNATRHMEEAQIVSAAGQRGRITIATNMAGRGTDIELGPGVAALGGLHVLATERHESGRIDRQLFGRAGRQGDPGSAQAFISAEDELIGRYVRPALQRSLRNATASAMPGHRSIGDFVISLAQRTAQRQAFRQRQQVLQQDNWLDEALAFAGASR